MRFKFKAIKPSGEQYEGMQEAADKFALYHELKEKGETVIFAEEEKTSRGFKIDFSVLSILNGVNTNEKINFARNLGSMLDAGLPLTRCLSVLERQTRNKKLKSIFSRIQEDVNHGETLSQSITKFPGVFSPLFVSMVKAGEESGSIAQSMKSVSEQMEKTHTLVKRLRGAMIYPSIVVSAMILIGILLLVFLVPSLTQTFEELNLDLPLSTLIIITLSSFLKNNIISSIIFLIFLVSFVTFLFRTKGGKRALAFVFLRLPIISSLVKESNSAKTARTLGTLLSSGVDFLVAIQITQEVIQNTFYKDILKKAEEKVRKGETVSSVFLGKSAERLYPPFVGEMVNIGEETGKLADMFANIASFYEEEIDQKTKNFSTVVEPLLMILIGLFVGIFAVSMLGPIYSLVDAL